MAVVSIVKEKRAFDLVKEAFDLISLNERLNPNSKVFIKPNLVRVPPILPYKEERGAYETTVLEGDIVHPDIVEGVLRYLHEKGVRKIVIGEAAGGCETSLPFGAYGFYAMADKYNVKLIDLNYSETVKVPVKDRFLLDYVMIPKVILEADLIINVAIMKVTGSTVVSLCLKNWGLGILPGKYYGWNKTGIHVKGCGDPLPIHQLGTGEQILGQEVSVSQAIVDVAAAKGWQISLIDGLTSLYYKGFSSRDQKRIILERTNMVIASDDMVAADAVASMAMSLDPSKILHIKWAEERGLGTCTLSKMKLKGASIEEIKIRGYPNLRHKEIMID